MVTERIPGTGYRKVMGRHFTVFDSSFSHNPPLLRQEHCHIEKCSLWSKCANDRHGIRSKGGQPVFSGSALTQNVLNVLERHYTLSP